MEAESSGRGFNMVEKVRHNQERRLRQVYLRLCQCTEANHSISSNQEEHHASSSVVCTSVESKSG